MKRVNGGVRQGEGAGGRGGSEGWGWVASTNGMVG